MPNQPNHRYLYKRTSISGTPEELLKRRIAINETLRKKHREQLITAKRFRYLSRQEELNAIEQTTALARDLRSTNKVARMEAIQSLGKFVVEPAEALIEYITQGDCMEVLTVRPRYIAAGPYDLWAKSIVSVPFMINLLYSDNPKLQEQAAHAIGNMACEDLGSMSTEVDEVRSRIRNNGAVPPLVRMLDSNDSKTIQTACFALANLALGKESEMRVFLDADVDKRLMHHLSRETTDTVTDIAGVIQCLVTSSKAFQSKMIHNGFLPLMIKLADDLKDEDSLALPFLRTFGILAHSSDNNTELLLQQPGFLTLLLTLIESEQRMVKKEALWVLNNITANQKPVIVEQTDVPQLAATLTKLVQVGHFDMRQMAATCLLNIMHHDKKSLDSLDHRTILKAMLDFLRSQDADLIRLGLSYIDNLMNYVTNGKQIIDNTPNVMDALAAVNPAPDPELYDFANKLVDTYYNENVQDMQE
ncbi:armadillo-type protein [Gongronella butleri]|nr:armadillo-type protein [Gongronella butleri]